MTNPTGWTGTSGLSGDMMHPRIGLRLADPDEQERIGTAVRDAGYDVITSDEDGALQAAVVVLDLRNAAEGALETLEQILGRKEPPHVIGVVDEATLDRGRSAILDGAWAVLTAPIQDEVLLARLRHAIGDWHKSRQLWLHEAVAGAIHDVILGVDTAGTVSFLNDAAARVFQVSAADVVGQPVSDLLGVEISESFDPDENVEYAIRSEPGNDDVGAWLRGNWIHVRDGMDRPLVRLLVAREVTRERSLRKDLVRSGALAELGLMATEVAHEVNNPATYLMTNLSMLRDDLSSEAFDTEQAIEMIEECLDGVTRITEIVRRMRNLAAADAEDMSTETWDLSTVVRDACRIAGLRVKYKADLHIHDPVFPKVQGSPKRIGQVVLNLVVNAADALSGQMDPMPRIDLTLGEEDGWVLLDVRDNGPGIPAGMRDRMFEAFVSSKVDRGGTGLGLAVSRTIADEHGGELLLVNHDERGAWFQLRLPSPTAG